MKVVSMRGEVLDMSRYIAKHAETVALGNAGMNARGDLVGPGGKVIKRAEQISAEYHRANPKAVKQVSLKNLASEVLTPAEAVKAAEKKGELAPVKRTRKIADKE